MDTIVRIRSVVLGLSPWPAHLLASCLQIAAMVRNLCNILFVVVI